MFIIYYHGLWTCSMASFLLSPCLNHQLCVCKQTSEQARQTESERVWGREREGGWEREKRERYFCHWKKRANQAYSVTLAVMCIGQQCYATLLFAHYASSFFFDSAVGFLVAFVFFFSSVLSFIFFFLLFWHLLLLLLFVFIFWLCSYKDVMRNDMSTIPWEF